MDADRLLVGVGVGGWVGKEEAFCCVCVGGGSLICSFLLVGSAVMEDND